MNVLDNMWTVHEDKDINYVSELSQFFQSPSNFNSFTLLRIIIISTVY